MEGSRRPFPPRDWGRRARGDRDRRADLPSADRRTGLIPEARSRYRDGNYGHDCAERAVEDAPAGWHRPGTKYHIATAGNGVPVAYIATAANVNDTLLFERLFLAAFAVMARIRTVFADKGYEAEHHRKLCRAFRAEPSIHKRGQPRRAGLGQRRWPVERSNARVLENRRLALRYDRLGFIIQSLLHAARIVLVAKRLARQF